MRVMAIVIRIIQQFFRDKRTLALMLVAPLFILTLMHFIFDSEAYMPKIGVYGAPEQLVAALEKNGAVVEKFSKNAGKDHIEEKDLDAFLAVDQGKQEILVEGSDPSVTRAVLGLIQKSAQPVPQGKADISYVHGSEEMSSFDYIGPVLIGVFIFFFVFLISGVSFLRERTSGTLDRIMATPLKRYELVLGYVIGFGIFTTFQAILISAFSISVLDMMMEGSYYYVLLITFLLAMTSLTLGTLLSAFAGNELQMFQFIPLIIVPQVFFSGLFKLETMAEWLQAISYAMPLKYGADALQDIMIRGNGWEQIANDVYVLLGFAVLFLVLNIFALKKVRRL
ncbi:ABC transporter permease [Metabacillus indicus]|uniref:ABC transporter permease n=1 Tax=Metabacillus indicus TaxID=246786 RepID=UPI0024939226|nr:ABC transporter permease [Metabacillus indicus]